VQGIIKTGFLLLLMIIIIYAQCELCLPE
jgi:hypothetical protein